MASTLIKLLGVIIMIFACRNCVAEESYLLPLPANYASSLRPNIRGPPTEVTVSAYISHLKFKHNKIEAVFYFRTNWTDSRLKSNKSSVEFLTFKGKDAEDKIWTPDLYFPNSAGSREVISKGMIRLSTNTGHILRSQMLKETFACSNLSVAAILAQPSQTVNCTIEVESYGYNDNDIKINVVSPFRALNIDDATKDQELFNVNSFTVTEAAQVLSTGRYSRISFVINVGSPLSKIPRMTLLHLLEHRGRN